MASPHRFVVALAALLALATGRAGAAQPATRPADKPNVVFLLADDLTFSDVPVWGGVNVKTPNLDRLAAEGMTFDRAYVSMPMCSPTRAAFYTGLYPPRNGTMWNHANCKPGTESWPQHLGRLGYRVGLTGKKDVRPEAVVPFEHIRGATGNPVGETADFDTEGVREFVTRDPGQPFAVAIGFTSPHVPWTVGDPAAFDRRQFKLPPHLPDNPGVRKAFADYLAEVAYLDGQIGEVMAVLKETGHDRDTIVVFSTEQGAQMPGAKWCLWDIGTHTGLIVRWPGVVKPGTRTDALAQDVDLLPTLIAAGGGDPKAAGDKLDGYSLLPVLKGEADKTGRQYVYTINNQVPEGPPYPIRAVSDGRMTYIRNLAPGHAYLVKFTQGGDGRDSQLWHSMIFSAHLNPDSRRLIDRVILRPAEELYDLSADPANMHNLIGDPAHAADKARLSAALDEWMSQVGDPGAAADDVTFMRAAMNGPAGGGDD